MKETMKVRVIEGIEKELFLKREQEAIYPELSEEEFRKWIKEEEEPYAPLYLGMFNEKDEFVGGSAVAIWDFLDLKRIILVLEAFWVEERYRKKGYGFQLLLGTFKKSKEYYSSFGKNAVGIFIQTEEQTVNFYKKTLKRVNIAYSVAKKKMEGIQVYVFLVPFNNILNI